MITCKFCSLNSTFSLCAHGACAACRIGALCIGCLREALTIESEESLVAMHHEALLAGCPYAHTRLYNAQGSRVDWTYNSDGTMARSTSTFWIH